MLKVKTKIEVNQILNLKKKKVDKNLYQTLSSLKLIINSYLINASSPSNIATNDLTSVYIVPSNESKSEEQVIKSDVLIKEVAKGGF